MANKILVFVEQRNGQIKKSSFEAVGLAKKLSEKLGCETEAVCVGNNVEATEQIGGYGVTKLTLLKNEAFELYSPSGYAKAVADHAAAAGADIIFIPNTAMGKDLAPRITIKLDAGIAMDCIALEAEGDSLTATRPVYAGKALIDVALKSAVKVFTLRPNVFSPGEPTETKAEVVTTEIPDPDLSCVVTEVKKSEGKLDVSEAEIIVSGGRGMKGPEHFNLIEDLADALGAAVGASRAVVDAGWRPHAEQVGQTGKTVSPNLYIAAGISGAIQHLAGMRSSKYIVAINKDKDAPIFQVADYGIAGDAFEVLPALIEEIKKVKSE